MKSFSEKAVQESEVQRLIEGMKWVVKYPMPVIGAPEGLGAKSVTNQAAYRRLPLWERCFLSMTFH